MGNAAPRANLGSQIPEPKLYLSHDLPKFIFHSQTGHGKFMKSYLTRVDGVLSLLKVYIRPPDEVSAGCCLAKMRYWVVCACVCG